MALVLKKPNYPPYVCIVCGLGSGRKWFVDLQLAIDNYFNPVNDGAIYLCNECWDSILRAVGQQAQVLMLGQEPWESQVEITYAAEGELITAAPLRGVGSQQGQDLNNGTGLPSEGPGELNFATTGDDSTSTNTTSEPNTDTATTTEPVREFREFFGKPI